MPLVIHFGAEVRERELALRNARVAQSPHVAGCFESDSLCAFQRDQHRSGFRSAEIVTTIYGASVRAGSGIDNFHLMKGRSSRDEAMEYARNWQAADPAKRYVFERVIDPR